MANNRGWAVSHQCPTVTVRASVDFFGAARRMILKLRAHVLAPALLSRASAHAAVVFDHFAYWCAPQRADDQPPLAHLSVPRQLDYALRNQHGDVSRFSGVSAPARRNTSQAQSNALPIIADRSQ